jgi:DNA-binding LytR/AlgR family response regulator
MRERVRAIMKQHNIDASVFCAECAATIPVQYIENCNIAFLDIDFAGTSYNGIDLAKRVRQTQHDAVIIFVTNYIEYAPEGYELQAFRYVLKKDIDKKLPLYLLQAIEKNQTVQQTMQINISGETHTLALAEVVYFESQGHTVIIHVQKAGYKSEKTYRFYSTMSKLEGDLENKGFLRIQKGYLVNIAHLHRLQCQGATLNNGTVLPVSEKNYSELKKKYLIWKGKR